uniref:RNase H type-1 domain-containing protein n=1 Tax=Arion vulgaris TaxID=1028688 RepID=A0A0B6ZA82_9EUPU
MDILECFCLKGLSLEAEWLDSIQRSHLCTLTWLYTPGHAELQNNEHADFRANNVPTQAGKSMGRTDVIIAVHTLLLCYG